MPRAWSLNVAVSAFRSESELVDRLSSSWSESTTLSTTLPPGAEREGFNMTMVVSVSDTLGSIAATNLGVDGAPLIVSSAPPQEEVRSLAS